MTKAEELKVLDKIAKLIESAGDDSYIALTFKGMVDIAKSNIENDFGDSPVEDLKEMREELKAKEQFAKAAYAEMDSLREDFAVLEDAYREAVKTVQMAQPYIFNEDNRLKAKVDALPVDADEDVLCTAVRVQKKAAIVLRKCSEVLYASQSRPLCFAMQE